MIVEMVKLVVECERGGAVKLYHEAGNYVDVRGLNEGNKHLRVRNLLHDWKVDIMCFQEIASMFVTEFGVEFMVV
jgi:mRNA deadenylase 3'-5' endonuclease subunit Ccr4